MALKIDCICLPLFNIESTLRPDNLADIGKKVSRASLGIFVSRNAAELLLPYLDLNLKLQWACMGPATAGYLQQNGISNSIYPRNIPFDSLSLVEALKLNNIALLNQAVVLFTGENQEHLLAKELEQESAIVEVIEVYRRVLPKIARKELEDIFVAGHKLDMIIISCVTSLKSLVLLTKSINFSVLATPLLVISERIYKHAIDMGFLNVYTAKGMSDKAILAALLDWREFKQE